MCGIVGVVSNYLSVKEKEIFSTLLYVDAVRGMDSTGVLVVGDKFESSIIKAVGSPMRLFAMPEWGEKVEKSNGPKLLLGHNRSATRGEVTIDNAHPFTHGPITLVHNGSLFTHSNLSDKEHNVDSDAIAYALAQGDIVEVSKKLHGSYSLVWYNSDDRTINFARNKDRPMHFTTISNGATLIWASEKLMLEWVLDRNNYSGKVESTPPNKHIKFPVKGPYKEYDHRDIHEPETMAAVPWFKGKDNVIYSNNTAAYNADRYDKFNNRSKFKSTDLSRVGLKRNEEVTFSVYKKQEYNYGGWEGGLRRGTIYGMLENYKDEDYIEIVAYNVDINKFDYKSRYKGKALALSGSNYNDTRVSMSQLPEEIVIDGNSIEPLPKGDVITYYKGPEGKYLPGYKLLILAKDGCHICKEPITEEDLETVHWDDKEPVCSACHHDPFGNVGV
jgi:hypothetical protein